MSASFLVATPTNLGDFSCRDVFHRNQYLRSSATQVSTKSYSLSGSTALNTVTQLSTLNNDLSGRFSVLVKNSSSTLSDTDTPALDVDSQKVTANVDLKTTGSFAIGDVITAKNGTTLSTTFPSSLSVQTLSVNSSSGTSLASVTSTGLVTLSGSVQVTGSALVSQDLDVTGETTLYGITTIAADLTNASKLLFTGTSSAGIVIGSSLTSSTASLLYSPTASLVSDPSFQTSEPIIFRGTSTGTQLGDSLTVFDATDTTKNVSITSQYIQINDTWRMGVDTVTNSIIFQLYESSTWVTKARITP